MSIFERIFRVLMKGALGLLLLLLIAVAAALFYLRNAQTRSSLANSFLKKISLAGATLTIEDVGFGEAGSIQIVGGRLAQGDSTVARIDTLRVKSDPVRLVTGEYIIDDLEVTSGEVDVALLRRTFAPDTAAAAPDSAGGDLHLTFRRIRLRDLHVLHAGVPDSGAARVSLERIAHLDGRFEMQGDRIEVGIDSLDARGGLGEPDSIPVTLTARGKWRPEALEADTLSITTERSAISGRGSMRFGENGFDLRSIDAELTTHPLAAEDVAAFAPQAPPGARLELEAQLKEGVARGTARLDADSGSVAVERFEVKLADLPRWNATADLGPSAWSGRKISGAHLEVASSEGTITALAAIQSSGGSLDVRGAITDPGPNAWIEVREAVFRDVDLAVWSGAPGMSSDLSGRFSGSARGTDPKTMRAKGVLHLQKSRFAKFEVDETDVDLALDRGLLDLNGTLRREEGEARVVGSLQPWANPLRAQGTVVAHGTVRDFAVDSLLVRAVVTGDIAEVDTLLLVSPALDAHGSGTLGWNEASPSTGDFRLRASLKDAAPIARLAKMDSLAIGSAELEAHVRGPVQRARVDATLSAREVQYGAIVVHEVDGSVEHDAATGRTSFDATAAADSGSVAARGTVLRTSGTPESTRFDLESLELANGSERWQLVHPTTILLAGPRIDVDDARFESGTSAIAIDGTIDRRGSQDLRVEARAFDLQTIETLLGRPVQDGTLDAKLEIAGSAAAPRAGGDIRLVMRVREREAGILATKFETDGTRTQLEGTLAEPAGSQLTFEGSLPFALSLEAAADDTSSSLLRKTDAGVDVRISGKDVALTVVEPFLDPQSVQPREGTITVDLEVSGPFESLRGNGSLQLADGVVEFPMQNVVYEDIGLQILLEGDRARIPELKIRSGDGTLRGSGEIAMSKQKIGDARLQLTAEKFRSIRSSNLQMTLSGTMDLTRTSDALKLTGKVNLDQLEYFLDPTAFNRDNREIVLTEADHAMLVETFGPNVTAERSTFLRDALNIAEIDVTVRAERNVWIRQRSEPRMSVELEGTVQAKKAPEKPFEFFGELRPIEGRGFVEQFGRRFELSDGEVILNGDPALTHFRIESTYEVVPFDDPSGTEVIATLTLTGTPSDYDLVLSSDQGLSTSEITTLIVTGSTGGFEGGGSDRNQVAAGTAVQAGLTPVTGAVEEIAGEAVGLDVFQIRQDGLNGVTLIAGKYARPKFYVGLRQPVLYEAEDVTDRTEDGDVELELEYSASKRLQVNFRGEGDALRLFLRTSHAY